MKFLSFEHEGRQTWGALSAGGTIVDLGQRLSYRTLQEFIASGDYASRDDLLKGVTGGLREQDIKFLPVITQPEKVVCLARNYLAHHKESVAGGLVREITNFPPIFLRVWRSQIGHLQPIVRPRVSDQLDWEGELAVVIGRSGRHVREEDAMSYVAGYACYNDASVRDYQFHAYQITAGKNFVGTGPFGPYLVTPDEIPNPADLHIETRVNGTVMQESNTSQLVFGIARIISYCSDIFDISPGDVIATGTPAGVGWARDPKVWLQPGDLVEVEIEKVGLLSNRVVQE